MAVEEYYVLGSTLDLKARDGTPVKGILTRLNCEKGASQFYLDGNNNSPRNVNDFDKLSLAYRGRDSDLCLEVRA